MSQPVSHSVSSRSPAPLQRAAASSWRRAGRPTSFPIRSSLGQPSAAPPAMAMSSLGRMASRLMLTGQPRWLLDLEALDGAQRMRAAGQALEQLVQVPAREASAVNWSC